MRTAELTRIGQALGLACALTACATAVETTPQEPLAVKVTEMSPEVADDIAARVAERLAPGTRAVAPQVRVPARPRVGTIPVVRPTPPTPKRAPVEPSVDTHPPVDNAIELALGWLARRQQPDGRWQSGYFDAESPAAGSHDVGVTGLAVLCFLENGHTHHSGAHKEVVGKALRYLKGVQSTKGVFGPQTSQHFMYDHAAASLAMVTAYGLTKSPVMKDSAELAVDFIHRAQNPYLGWRYSIRDGDNDTSVTGFMVAVLAAARQADLDVDDNAFKGALAWVDKMTEPEFGRVGYINRGGMPARTMEAMEAFPADRSEAPTAIGLHVRLLAGQDAQRNEFVRKGADLLAAKPPLWSASEGTIDMYYWFWGTLALRDVGGAHWRRWSDALATAVGGHQVVDAEDPELGSWEPVDAWSPDGGRVYATAMCCLSLSILEKAGHTGPK